MQESITRCLGHLLEAEKLLEAVEDQASLARLSLVIDLLRRDHGLPDRLPDLAIFALG